MINYIICRQFKLNGVWTFVYLTEKLNVFTDEIHKAKLFGNESMILAELSKLEGNYIYFGIKIYSKEQ